MIQSLRLAEVLLEFSLMNKDIFEVQIVNLLYLRNWIFF